jgi:hypothetical protein
MMSPGRIGWGEAGEGIAPGELKRSRREAREVVTKSIQEAYGVEKMLELDGHLVNRAPKGERIGHADGQGKVGLRVEGKDSMCLGTHVKGGMS